VVALIAPAEDAAKSLGKATHWRVYKKPPTIEQLTGEPVGSILTALVSRQTRALVIKVGDQRWISVEGELYEDCVERWRAVADAGAPILDDAAITALLPTALYAWCINRMYTAAGTLPPSEKSAKPKRATTKSRSAKRVATNAKAKKPSSASKPKRSRSVATRSKSR